MWCPDCPTVLADTAEVCSRCGRRFSAAELAAVGAVLQRQLARARRRRLCLLSGLAFLGALLALLMRG